MIQLILAIAAIRSIPLLIILGALTVSALAFGAYAVLNGIVKVTQAILNR